MIFASGPFSLANHSKCVALKLFLLSWLLHDTVNWGMFLTGLGRFICVGVVVNNILPDIL